MEQKVYRPHIYSFLQLSLALKILKIEAALIDSSASTMSHVPESERTANYPMFFEGGWRFEGGVNWRIKQQVTPLFLAL